MKEDKRKMRDGKIKLFHKISIKSKFLMMILGIAVACIAVVGFQGLHYGKASLTKSMYDHLTSLQSAKTQQIEEYFKNKQKLMKTFSSQNSVVEAMSKFRAGFNLLDTYGISIDQNSSDRLLNFYKDSYIDKLNKNSIKEYAYTTMLPKKDVVKYLQYHYIINNPSPIGKKELMESADDKSYYSEVHQDYHETLLDIVQNQGFNELFLIDVRNMHIVYSTKKDVDFATSLEHGPYAHSSLAKVVRRVISNPDKGVVNIADFKAYKPLYNVPQSFFAIPIYQKNKFIGVLATQISMGEINSITTGHESWEHEGLGVSGEVYLVGRDYKMRSDSRKIIQTPEKYMVDLNKTNLHLDKKRLISVMQSTVLNQDVYSEAVKLATEGKEGTIVAENYLKKKVLSAYAPLKIDGLDWTIIAEKEIKEAEEPIIEFQNALLISSTILATLITFYAIWLAYTFLAPISSMARGVKNIISGKSKDKISLNRQDEFGDLSDNIDKMIDTISTQEHEIEKKSKENDELLLNILPQTIATRVKKGETNIAESIPNVAVLFTSLKGFDQLSQNISAKESIMLLNEIINEFDNQAEEYGIEKITTIGDSYMAASGLITPRLDYARRVEEYAQKLFEVVANFNSRHRAELELSIGIDCGEVMAGIVGKYKFVYDIWGEVVNDASRISHEAHPGTLKVSEIVYDQLINKDEYEKCKGGSEITYVFVSKIKKS